MTDLDPNALKPIAEVVKAVAEAIKAVGSPTAPNPEKSAPVRGGPLQVVGRLYVALAAIVALAASAAGYIDMRAFDASKTISPTTHALRCVVIVVVVGGLGAGLWLVWFLANRHPSLLFSPTEYSGSVHASLMDRAEESQELTDESESENTEMMMGASRSNVPNAPARVPAVRQKPVTPVEAKPTPVDDEENGG